MKVAIFGATGFVGRHVLTALTDNGHQAIAMIRPGSESKAIRKESITWVSGDIHDQPAISQMLQSADAVLYSIGTLREFPAHGVRFYDLHFEAARRVANLACESGVNRFLLMSANGANAQGNSYQRSKYLAEEYLKTTALDSTIFRPSVIFGEPDGCMEFASRLCRDIVCSPLPAPLFFDGLWPGDAGSFRLSPIHVKDVARIVVESLSDDETCGHTLELGGPEALTWRDILKRISAATGRAKPMLPVPAWGVRRLAQAMDRFPFFPLTRDQLDMLLAGNTCDGRSVFEHFGITPRHFDTDNLAYLRCNSQYDPAGCAASELDTV
jgi:uncharacterized protein YbjT (DUF2867 family)